MGRLFSVHTYIYVYNDGYGIHIKPLIKIIGELCAFINNIKIRKKLIYQKLSFMNSSDVYYAIKNYIPTRFSQENLSDYDETDIESKSDGT